MGTRRSTDAHPGVCQRIHARRLHLEFFGPAPAPLPGQQAGAARLGHACHTHVLAACESCPLLRLYQPSLQQHPKHIDTSPAQPSHCRGAPLLQQPRPLKEGPVRIPGGAPPNPCRTAQALTPHLPSSPPRFRTSQLHLGEAAHPPTSAQQLACSLGQQPRTKVRTPTCPAAYQPTQVEQPICPPRPSNSHTTHLFSSSGLKCCFTSSRTIARRRDWCASCSSSSCSALRQHA